MKPISGPNYETERALDVKIDFLISQRTFEMKSINST